MKIVLILILFGCAVVHSAHMNVNDLNSDYIQNILIKSTSNISNIDIPNACQTQLLYMSQNWKRLNIFPMIDSWGKIPIGLMYGNVYALGNYEECINFSTELPNSIGYLEGKYCRMSVPLTINIEDIIQTNNVMNPAKERQSRAFEADLKFGICLPKVCTSQDLDDLLPFKITSCKINEPIPFEPIDYISTAIYSIIAILLVLGTCYDSFYRGDQKNNFLVSFSVLSNAEKLFQVSNEKKKSNIDCLNGIRVLSMMWVIYGHTFASNSAVPKINFIDYNKWTQKFLSVFVYNPYISVDSFFFMSGLLLSWIGMREIEKRNGKLNILQMYFQRYMRLTPMVAFMILFVVSSMKYFKDGPLIDEFIARSGTECEGTWWMNLVYIQNYAANPMCLGPVWYLAVDFQLFLFSPLILYGFWRWGKKCFIGAAMLIAISVGCIYGIFYKYGITGALLLNGANSSDRMDHYYYKTHTRYSIWLIGMCFGYILYRSKDIEVKISWYTQIIGWIASAGILYGVTLAPQTTIHGFEISSSTFSAATYESFSKIGWGFMLSFVVFICYHGYGGIVNSFMSNPLWQPLAKLSFSMFMCHMTIITIINGNTKTMTHFSDFESILEFWKHFGIILLISIGLALTVELPMSNIVRNLKSNPKVDLSKSIQNDARNTNNNI